MSAERILEDAREQVRKIVPSHINITSIDFEGPVVVIYTKDMDAFASNNDIVRQLAQGLRRRVAIRPDASLLADPDIVEKRIREIIPEEAQITDIFFEPETGEVTIEAIAPGLVIGKQGAVLNEIKKEVGWAPKVVRAPPIPSKTVSEIRSYLRHVQTERKEFLRKTGRKLARQKYEGESWIRLTALGGFREVGRSASLLSTRDSKILIDCGSGRRSRRCHTLLQCAGDPAPGPDRLRRHYACSSGPLRTVAGTLQIRLRRAGLLYRPDSRPDVPAAAGLYQGGQLGRQEEPLRVGAGA